MSRIVMLNSGVTKNRELRVLEVRSHAFLAHFWPSCASQKRTGFDSCEANLPWSEFGFVNFKSETRLFGNGP
jgi:hypothetical protein